MPQILHVHLLPSLIEPDALRDGTAIIIDILRASSTMVTALHNGADRVIPCGTPEEAILFRQRSAPGAVVLGGERGGVKIPDFDFGNSPAEYRPALVHGRTLAFTTTNGTKALLKAFSSREILVGSFLNRQALVDRLERDHLATHLICAGTDGRITGEDVLFAGAIVDALVQRAMLAERPQAGWVLNDSAEIARGYWQQCAGQPTQSDSSSPEHSVELALSISDAMRTTRGGKNLLSLGYDADLTLCSQLDAISMVPRYDRNEHCLVAAE